MTAEENVIDTTIIENVEIEAVTQDDAIESLVEYADKDEAHSNNLDALVDRLLKGLPIALVAKPYDAAYYEKLTITKL
jgi:hypothetical protein